VFSAKFGVLTMGYQVLQHFPLDINGLFNPLINVPVSKPG
jgi:hypothetical protein